MNLLTVKLDETNFELWDDFCLKNKHAWFWHTVGSINFNLNYRPELETKNLSFFVYKSDRPVAIVPLTLDKISDDIFEFSFAGTALPGPVLSDDLSKMIDHRSEKDLIWEFIFKEIDRLALEYKVKRVSFRQTPLADNCLGDKQNYNYLLKHGYLDISFLTRFIDLTQDREILWKQLRRNHRRCIEKADNFGFLVFTKDNITKEIFDEYRMMHKKAAGRVTRPLKTFELMYDYILDSTAVLTAATLDDKFIGFEYYSIYKNLSYGNSAANDPDFEKDYPIRHFIEWNAMLWMKNEGIKIYEIGLQQYADLLYDFPSEKQINISHFKRGFGGYDVPWFIGEKYYDRSYFLLHYQKRIAAYADKMNNNK